MGAKKSTYSKDDIAQISPNLIGFQFVLFGIASRIIKHKKQASKIIFDQQIEFNKAQRTLQDIYSKFPKNYQTEMGHSLPDFNLRGMPAIPIVVLSSRESTGLELVDIFLWVFKRYFERQALPQELLLLLQSQMPRSRMDEVSLEAISKRWGKWFQENLMLRKRI